MARAILHSIERKRAADDPRKARDELEARVQQRTAELVKANLLLQAEVAERKRLEDQLVLAQKLEAIGHLAAGIAHEINSPMQYVGDNMRFLHEAFADLDKLLQKYHYLLAADKAGTTSHELVAEVDATAAATDVAFLTQEIPYALQQSQQGIERVTNIVRAMKEFSHPGTADKTPTDLNRAIETTITVARNEWKYVADEDAKRMLVALGKVVLRMTREPDSRHSDRGDAIEAKDAVILRVRTVGIEVQRPALKKELIRIKHMLVGRVCRWRLIADDNATLFQYRLLQVLEDPLLATKALL